MTSFYWACELCGASPLPRGGKRWFETEADALHAGAPKECSNVYCHSNSQSPYFTEREGGWYRVHQVTR